MQIRLFASSRITVLGCLFAYSQVQSIAPPHLRVISRGFSDSAAPQSEKSPHFKTAEVNVLLRCSQKAPKVKGSLRPWFSGGLRAEELLASKDQELAYLRQHLQNLRAAHESVVSLTEACQDLVAYTNDLLQENTALKVRQPESRLRHCI
jgi:hypothetical protein